MDWLVKIVETLLENKYITASILIITLGIFIYLILAGVAKITEAWKHG